MAVEHEDLAMRLNELDRFALRRRRSCQTLRPVDFVRQLSKGINLLVVRDRRMLFEWDDQKARANLAKHGVSFAEAETVFTDPLAGIAQDPDHSDEEDREIVTGHSDRRRLLLVSFTQRGDSIRIMSAREATRSERKLYEEKKSDREGR